ncbi:hypothetical protein POM88_043513 [Heracleum sosnowskyi]|uniref:EamA domain-containing protein n=1 Tax=Heracleum sosnowskyi TaxID=360622 RepID=A0AAD8H3I0_9APIA|nr:hypothetical protein POM88_043513 [Heracleum sosnowskyi]
MTRVLSLQSFTTNVLPFAVMIMAECIEVTFLSLGKAAMNNGISSFVFVAYYNSMATLIFFPFFVLHVCRGNQLPLTFSLLCRFFVLGLVGICLLQICGYVGMDYASATLGVAMGNLIPAFTFLLAVILSMEKVDLRPLSSVSKVVGTAIAISGAFLIYMVVSSSGSAQQLLLSKHSNWVLGGGFLTITCLSSAIWNILQAATIKVYSGVTTVNFFFCLFGSIQCTTIALYVERNRGSWLLNPGIEMIAMVFAAVNCVTGASILTWCLHRKGPVYVSMFKPVSTAIAMITGIIFLGDTLYIGRSQYIISNCCNKDSKHLKTIFIPEDDDSSTALAHLDQSDDEMLDEQSLAVSMGSPPHNKIRKEDKSWNCIMYTEQFRRRMKYTIAPTSVSPDKRKQPSMLLQEGKQRSSLKADRDEVYAPTKPEIDAELAKMRSMTPEQAAAVAARAVAEAEIAMAEAEEAAREAEAAEADAEAAQAFAEAAMKTLKGRSSNPRVNLQMIRA